MAILTWTGFSGDWNDPTQWLTGTVPGPGDIAVFPTGSATMTGLSIVNETIDITGGTQLTWNNTTFDSASDVIFNNATLFTLADVGSVINNGTMAYGSGSGEIDLYLIPGTVTPNFTNNGMFSLNEPFKLLGFGNLTNAGTLELLNLTGSAVAMTVTGFGAAIVNNGSFIVDGSGSPSAATTATVKNVSGTGTIALTDAQFIATNTVAATQTFDFMDAHGALVLSLPTAPFDAMIKGFQPGDSIDLGTGQADAVSFASGVLTISYQTTPKYTLNFAGAYQTSDFSLTLNALSHQVLTTSTAPCFAGGTRISTSRGEIAVEHLRIGDLVHVETRGVRPITWIGHRRIDCTRHPDPRAVWPIRVRAGAFGDHRPRRDLWLSPDHAVFIADALIPVKYLINGSTIAQVPVDSVGYYHVELATHGVIFAEGLPTESYLDTGDRMSFANGGAVVALHPGFASSAREAGACAPLVVTGPLLAAVRRQLEESARLAA